MTSVVNSTGTTDFYPRSPCGERLLLRTSGAVQLGFLSTLSLRRATGFFGFCWSAAFDFYPRSPCGERRCTHCKVVTPHNFYPRSPCGERRLLVRRPLHRIAISIHALLAESDADGQHVVPYHEHFYPRSPCGERLMRAQKPRHKASFLSTLSLRRATAKVHKTVGHFCAYGTNFMGIASSC